MRVLAIGATGQFAGLVVPALVAKGVTVRALIHDSAKADRVRNLGVEEAVPGDLRDRASIDAALRGVDAVFHVTPAFAPDSAELGVDVVDAAVAAGVRRFVFSGVYHPSLSLVNHAGMRPVEEALYRSGLSSPFCSRRCSCRDWPAVGVTRSRMAGSPRPIPGTRR